MDGEIKLQKYRRLSVTAFIAGILAVFIIGIYSILFGLVGDFTQTLIFETYIMPSVFSIIISLAVVALICGSIDLSKIQAGIWSKKGRGLDITGIVLGGLFILIISVMMLSDILMSGQ